MKYTFVVLALLGFGAVGCSGAPAGGGGESTAESASEALLRCPIGEVRTCSDYGPHGQLICSCEPPSASVQPELLVHRCTPPEEWGCYDLGPNGRVICACQ
jgi:hypothetical protein